MTQDILFSAKRDGEAVKLPASELSERDLSWWTENAKNAAMRDAAIAELRRRSSGGPAAAQSPTAAPRHSATSEEAASAIQIYSGAHDDAKGATEALAKLQELGHLVSPAPACGTLPEGTAVCISAIVVDSGNETFQLPDGKRGLGKVPLCKISGALGVSWLPESGRLDDGSDPRYVHFRAIGVIREFDGSLRRIRGEKIMDLRVGSAQCEAYEKRAKDKAARSGGKVGDWESQIRDMRLFILEHAETKAQLRAIRSLGLRSSYSQEELQKPFFAAKLQFTGRSEDPEIRRMFAEMIASNMMGATRQLYGSTQPQARPQKHVVDTTGYAPPPVGRSVTADGEVVEDLDRGDDPDNY